MPNVRTSKSKYIFIALRIAVVVCGVIWGVLWVSRGERWSNLRTIFVRMDMWVFAVALGVFVISQIIVGLRWWLLLRTQSVFIKFWAAVRLHFLGLFYNNFMPSSVGGDLIRAWYVTKHTDRRFEAALSVFVDRAVGLLSALVIAGFFYAVFLRGRGPIMPSGQDSQAGLFQSVLRYKWFFLAIAAVLAAVFGVLLLHGRGRILLAGAWKRICKHAARVFGKLRKAIVLYCSNPAAIIAVFGLTLFLQIMVITSFWFLGMDLGIEASIKYYYVFFTVTWVLGAVPVSIGGAVVVEGLIVYFFVQLGVGKESALALALCQRAVWMLASLPGAVVHLAGAHLPKEFFIDYQEPIA